MLRSTSVFDHAELVGGHCDGVENQVYRRMGKLMIEIELLRHMILYSHIDSIAR